MVVQVCVVKPAPSKEQTIPMASSGDDGGPIMGKQYLPPISKFTEEGDPHPVVKFKQYSGGIGVVVGLVVVAVVVLVVGLVVVTAAGVVVVSNRVVVGAAVVDTGQGSHRIWPGCDMSGRVKHCPAPPKRPSYWPKPRAAFVTGSRKQF